MAGLQDEQGKFWQRGQTSSTKSQAIQPAGSRSFMGVHAGADGYRRQGDDLGQQKTEGKQDIFDLPATR